MARILLLTTSADRLVLADGTEHHTGFWAEELVVAHRGLLAAGHDVVIATPRGAPAPVDPGSLEPGALGGDDRAAEFTGYLASIDRRLLAPASVADLDVTTFDAVVIPGGHGPMADLAVDASIGALLIDADSAGMIIAPFCHGPSALLSAVRSDGTFAFEGRRMTAFTDDEERAGGLGDRAPWLLAERLGDLGAVLEHGDPWSSHVVRDRNLISGQNPQSSEAVVAAVVAALN
jgi:putative intracellular protease/amidase